MENCFFSFKKCTYKCTIVKTTVLIYDTVLLFLVEINLLQKYIITLHFKLKWYFFIIDKNNIHINKISISKR